MHRNSVGQPEMIFIQSEFCMVYAKEISCLWTNEYRCSKIIIVVLAIVTRQSTKIEMREEGKKNDGYCKVRGFQGKGSGKLF